MQKPLMPITRLQFNAKYDIDVFPVVQRKEIYT